MYSPALPLTGWIFDVYPTSGGMVVWIVDVEGKSHRLVDPFQPSFYAAGPAKALRQLAADLHRMRLSEPVGMTRRQEFWTGGPRDVLEFLLLDPERQPALLRHLAVPRPGIILYDCDLTPALTYCHARGIFPLAKVTVSKTMTNDGTQTRTMTNDKIPMTNGGTWGTNLKPEFRNSKLYCGIHETNSQFEIRNSRLQYQVDGSAWDLDYPEPPLILMALASQGDEQGRGAPIGKLRSLTIVCEGEATTLEEGDPETLLGELNRLIRRFDPHAIVTDWGDAFLVPALLDLARRTGVLLELDREVVRRRIRTAGRSYFSYGRVVYQAPSYPFFGRWHLDSRNSFILKETEVAGLLELSRLSKVPVQKMARTSPGSAISMMQLDRALTDGILVPWKKGEPERWKTAWDLLVADKGGLVYQPITGLYEGVAEIDFASMYPAMMVHHNISPETVDCACCPEAAAPEIGYSTCHRREGLVTRTLRPILTRRQALKHLRNAASGITRERYDHRQNALKWILVTCFGYLGYKNARFGRIEAHETVTAYAREKLLTARTLAEERGFRVLHAIVDSMWLLKPGTTDAEVQDLCRTIRDAVGIEINLEGIYKWVSFLPSRVDPNVSVANRYLGAFRSGELKLRGIDLRRSDTPPLVAEAQQHMVEALARADDLAGFKARIPEVLDIFTEYAWRLREGQVRMEELTIRRTVSKEAGEYKTNSQVGLASRQMADRGVAVHPGERVRYIISDADAKNAEARVRAIPFLAPDTPYDAGKYVELLCRAVETLLWHHGYDCPRLFHILTEQKAIPPL
ncbi:MAG TPA: DNA polymerase domain-containing protein [Candidatus Methylomirabilis sp.]|nr:DNA polymerase domain-containing protein [Candidatus Methylomirabilis sp.]